jgi:group I intron endonuclease
MESGIYRIRNTQTGSCYVGSAVNTRKRWKAHKCALRKKRNPGSKLQRAWDKYGEGAFEFEVLERCEPENLIAREQHYIDMTKPRYNTRLLAHSCLGVRHSKEVNMKKGRVKKTYTVRGVTGTAPYLAKHFGVVSSDTARWRVYRGWNVEDAFLKPGMDHKARGKRSAKVRDDSKRGRHETAFGVTANLLDLHRRFGVTSVYAFKQRILRPDT